MNALARKLVTGLALVSSESILYGFLGYFWYALTKPPWSQFGYEFEGFSQIGIGMSVGAVAGVLGGFLDLASSELRWRRRALLLLASGIAASLILLAISSIFMFIDADGPQGIEPYLRAAGLPAAVVLLFRLSVKRRRAKTESVQADAA